MCHVTERPPVAASTRRSAPARVGGAPVAASARSSVTAAVGARYVAPSLQQPGLLARTLRKPRVDGWRENGRRSRLSQGQEVCQVCVPILDFSIFLFIFSDFSNHRQLLSSHTPRAPPLVDAHGGRQRAARFPILYSSYYVIFKKIKSIRRINTPPLWVRPQAVLPLQIWLTALH